MSPKIQTIFIFLLNFCQILAQESCVYQAFLNTSNKSLYTVRVENYLLACSQIQFIETDKLNAHLGSVKVFAVENGLNVSFLDVKWKRAYLKLTNLDEPSKSVCKKYSVENPKDFPISLISDACFNNTLETHRVSTYLLEFKAELGTEILYKKIVFRTPEQSFYNNSLTLQKRPIFMSIDTSSNYEIILKIQTLPKSYDIKYYKVEVFREKSELNARLDIRTIRSKNTDELRFHYITYNEEGYYFFEVSVLNDICPEESCLKSVSPKVYIRRKYPPLVIGIVGASFMIPFVLFVFHMWTRKCQSKEQSNAEADKVFLIQNQTPEKHYQVLKIFEKTLKCLTKVQMVKNVTEATHLVYICGMYIFEPDPATYKYLMLESQNRDILVIYFPYSVQDTPTFLKNCVKFEFMRDFGKFIKIFNCEVDYLEDLNYQELVRSVKSAQIQSEPMKVILNMPTIIGTSGSTNDVSEIEPKEADVLL